MTSGTKEKSEQGTGTRNKISISKNIRDAILRLMLKVRGTLNVYIFIYYIYFYILIKTYQQGNNIFN